MKNITRDNIEKLSAAIGEGIQLIDPARDGIDGLDICVAYCRLLEEMRHNAVAEAWTPGQTTICYKGLGMDIRVTGTDDDPAFVQMKASIESAMTAHVELAVKNQALEESLIRMKAEKEE